LVEPPQISAIPKASIKDHLVQAGMAGQIRRAWVTKRSGPVGFMLLNLSHLDGQRDLRHGLEHEEDFRS